MRAVFFNIDTVYSTGCAFGAAHVRKVDHWLCLVRQGED